MEQKECSETSAYKIQTPGNYPEETIEQTDKIFFLTYCTGARFIATYMYNATFTEVV